ncbi:MAG: BMP family ABC transporter substrate-binding protein [Pseudomonadota bacterium]
MSRADAALLAALAFALVTCRGDETPPPPKGAPTPFPVAFVYSGTPGDQGWVDAQEVARGALVERLDWVHTTVRSGVTPDTAPEALDALASAGWRLIVVADPDLRAQTEAAAARQPATTFLLVGAREGDGVATRDGALEAVRFVAGIAAGARAVADGRPAVGCVARGDGDRERAFVDAAALGVRETCPDCRLLVRRIPAGAGPPEDVAAITALFQVGADVVFAATGGDDALAAVPPGRWLVARALAGPCEAAPDRCLTATFWSWVWTYDSVVKRVNDGSWRGGRELLGVDGGAVGLLGFMDREEPPPGIPADAIAGIRERFDRMKRGETPGLPEGVTPGFEELNVEER